MNSNTSLIFNYWGKAHQSDEPGGEPYHLLPYHCLDVTSVAAYWWDHSPALRHLFCANQSCSEEELRAWLLFFIALHDLGKFDIRFQCKAQNVWLALNPQDKTQRLPVIAECRGYDHGAAGLFWFIHDHEVASPDDGFGFSSPAPHPYQSWFSWLEAVCGHHGTIRSHAEVQAGSYQLLAAPAIIHRDKVARQQWLEVLAKLFLAPAGIALSNIPPQCSPLLAGFCSVADWLGSMVTEDTFQFRVEPCAEGDGLEAYYQQRYAQDAKKAVTRAGLLGKAKPNASIETLLSAGQCPRQLQVLVDELPIAAGLTLIEAPTGAGKTETALAYAWKLIEQNLADSIIFTLPTQATANAMLERMEKLAPLIFSNPNLVLAHGNARFNEQFQAIRHNGKNLQGENAWSQCCDWISQSRKRVFLGQIGVCTIDQVLISVLPLRHRFVRGFGVGRSVLIVDEVHAYDRYMYGLLEGVLQDQAKVGSPVILLSATLPELQKQLLLESYAPSADVTSVNQSHLNLPPYPLISWVSGVQVQCFDLTQQTQHLPPTFSVRIQPRYTTEATPDSDVLKSLIAAAQQGAQVCLICNRVDVAQHAYNALQTMASEDIELQLFHARFSLTDRKTKEAQALSSFGVQGERSIGRILVATQVVEQSLDIDFDWLVTQLCPVDLLFQRLGRLHRHSRTHRPEGFKAPAATVLLPSEEGFGVLGKIYSHTRVMWRTQRAIEALGEDELHFPAAYRAWIEPIYSEEPDDDEPGWVREGMETFEQDVFTQQLKARQMKRWAEQASLMDNDTNARAVTREGAQSITLVPYVQTAAGRLLLDGESIFEQLGEYQQQEALALNQVNVPESWRKSLDTEPDDYQRYWIVGVEMKDGWRDASSNFYYSRDAGMALATPAQSQTSLGTAVSHTQ